MSIFVIAAYAGCTAALAALILAGLAIFNTVRSCRGGSKEAGKMVCVIISRSSLDETHNTH